MAVHHPKSHAELLEMDFTKVYYDLMEKLWLVRAPEPGDQGYPHADLGHLVSGYDAGYYSYLRQVTFTLPCKVITHNRSSVLTCLRQSFLSLRSLRIQGVYQLGKNTEREFLNSVEAEMSWGCWKSTWDILLLLRRCSVISYNRKAVERIRVLSKS